MAAPTISVNAQFLVDLVRATPGGMDEFDLIKAIRIQANLDLQQGRAAFNEANASGQIELREVVYSLGPKRYYHKDHRG